MNKIEKGKKTLKNLSILSFVVNVAAVIIGAVFMVLGALALGDGKILQGIIELVIGVGFCAISIISLIIGVVSGATSSSIKATQGSIVEDNLGHGTANAILCSKCGNVLNADDEFCPNCGDGTSKIVKCTCGVENDKDADFCVRCGAKLK